MTRQNYSWGEEIDFLINARQASYYYLQTLKDLNNKENTLKKNIKSVEETIEYLDWKMDRMQKNYG